MKIIVYRVTDTGTEQREAYSWLNAAAIIEEMANLDRETGAHAFYTASSIDEQIGGQEK